MYLSFSKNVRFLIKPLVKLKPRVTSIFRRVPGGIDILICTSCMNIN